MEVECCSTPTPTPIKTILYAVRFVYLLTNTNIAGIKKIYDPTCCCLADYWLGVSKVLFVTVRFVRLAGCTIQDVHLVHYTKTQNRVSKTYRPLCFEILEGFYNFENLSE